MVTDEPSLAQSLSYFHVGINEGANLLQEELNFILERQLGYAECFDAVSGMRIAVKMMRAAHALEMDYFAGWACGQKECTAML